MFQRKDFEERVNGQLTRKHCFGSVPGLDPDSNRSVDTISESKFGIQEDHKNYEKKN